MEKKDLTLHLLKLNQLEDEVPKLELRHDENTFSISYMAIDYVNLGDYRYFYRIDKDNKGAWVDNGNMDVVSFSQLPPGDYTLQLKYRNKVTGYESKPVSMKIRVNPYWWQSSVMLCLYWLLFVGGVSYVLIIQYKRTRRRHAYILKDMEQKHKEELYEEKLRFFTDVIHEFSTPLTLIYGPCERILSYRGTDDYVAKYVKLIKKHTERLNQLIQEIIDYRRIETRHQQLYVESYNLSEYMHESCSVFVDLLEKNGINLIKDIEDDLYWNMDRRCFPKIVSNLLSNAVKYTPRDGTIKVVLKKISGNELQLRVYNTGKGIKEEDRIRIFNRYSILDEVEENASKILSRNGLGMAICHSSVSQLNGKIEINSEVGEYAEFVVSLSMLPLTEGGTEEIVKDAVPLIVQNQEIVDYPLGNTVEDHESKKNLYLSLPSEKRPYVLAIDDNKDMLFMLREALEQEYEVKTAQNADDALAFIRESMRI